MENIINLSLRLSNIIPNRDTVYELFGDEGIDIVDRYESTNEVKNTRIYDSVKTRPEDAVLNPELFSELLRDIRDMITKVRNSIDNKYTANNVETISNEVKLLCLRMSITRDNWYANKEKTEDRGPLVSHMGLLFILQMHLRLWRRYDLIMTKPGTDEMKSPIWCNAFDFIGGNWFYVDQEDNINDPIALWSPLKVYRAINALVRSRLVGAVDVTSRVGGDVFDEYRTALLDRISVLVVFPCNGLPDKLAPDKPNWFVLRDTIDVSELVEEGSHRALSKQVRKQMDDETQRFIRDSLIELDDNAEVVVESTDQLLRRIKRQKEEYDLIKLSDELKRMILRKELLEREDLSDGNEQEHIAYNDRKDRVSYKEKTIEELEDKAQIEKLTIDIADLRKLIDDIKAAVLNEHKTNREATSRILDDLLNNRSNETVIYISNATLSFVNEIMLIADNIQCWQFPGECNLRMYEESFNRSCQHIHASICNVVTKGNVNNVLFDSCKWIVGRSLILCERELYRLMYSSNAMFNTLDVCTSVRSIEETQMPGFPKDVALLLSDSRNTYHARFMEYSTWYWFQQSLPNMNIDATIYLWDAQEEYLSLNRVRLHNPVIAKIADQWCIINENGWDDENGNLNCTWFKDNIIACVYFWLNLMKDRSWHLHDRTNDKVFNIYGTPIYDVFMKVST